MKNKLNNIFKKVKNLKKEFKIFINLVSSIIYSNIKALFKNYKTSK